MMKKLVLCLSALFLCILMGCQTEEAFGTIEEASQKVVVVWDEKEETYDWVDQIGKKIAITEIGMSKKEEILNQELKDADLIIAGAYGTESDMEKLAERIINLEVMDGKRFSVFLVHESGETEEEWEYNIQPNENELVFLPGIIISEEKEERETELSRIDGWLTTIFTYQKRELSQ